MIRRHPMCKHQRCQICMDDHMALERLLRERCGGGKVDWLSKYHAFMKSRPGGAETVHGWATPESFEDGNIDAFVADWIGGEVNEVPEGRISETEKEIARLRSFIQRVAKEIDCLGPGCPWCEQEGDDGENAHPLTMLAEDALIVLQPNIRCEP